MRDVFTREMNAAVAGQQVMDISANVSIWNGKPAVANKKAELDAKILLIESLDVQVTDGTGLSVEKRNALIAGAKTAWKLAKGLAAFATDGGNDTLRAEIDFAWSDLRYAKDQDTIDRWRLVHNRASANSVALDTGGYADVALIATLQTQLDDFTAQRPKPHAKRVRKKGLISEITREVKKLMRIKKELIERLAQFADSHAAFYNATLDAFEVDMIGVRHRVARIVFEDNETGVRLKGVKMKVVELSMEKQSSKRGVIDLPQADVVDGNYTLVSELPDYASDTRNNFATERGKSKRVVVRMVKR